MQHGWLLVFFAVAGAVLYFFGCRLLETNGYHWACVPLLGIVILVFLFLTIGTRHSVR
jgi:hypothetical protein